MQQHDITKHLHFYLKSYEHTRYSCCACIEEKQIVVITKFRNQSLRNFATNELK